MQAGNRQAEIRQLIRGAAVLALCSASHAFAGTMIYPGLSCSSSGAVSKPANGALMNAEQSNGTSRYNCVAISTRSSNSLPYKVTARIYLQRNITTADITCALRSIDKLGNIITTESAPVPHWNDASSPKTYTRIISLVVAAPSAVRSYSLRCDIPNVEGGAYGVISYEITD